MSIFKKLRCMVMGHEYRVAQTFSVTSRRVVCDCCQGDWAMNDSVRAIIPWSGELEEMYRLFGHRIKSIGLDRKEEQS